MSAEIRIDGSDSSAIFGSANIAETCVRRPTARGRSSPHSGLPRPQPGRLEGAVIRPSFYIDSHSDVSGIPS